jgi:drug/metabolite transporter (DMT)-like permease
VSGWLSTHLGELAAAGTAMCWTTSAICFEAAGRRIGALPLNFLRLVIGFVLLSLLALVLRGAALPAEASGASWAWLSASGLVGFVFGDLCLFRAFLLLGARLTLLVQATSPAMAALLGFLVLGEGLGWRDLAGMALTGAGVIAAVSRRSSGAAPRVAGLWLALGGALGQAGGLVLSKLGLAGLHPVAGTQIRVLAGLVGFAAVLSLARAWPRLLAGVRDRRAVAWASAGSLAGPCLGVSLSLFAVTHTKAGIASAIMTTSPILVLPVARLRGEHVGVAGVVGALLAVAGVGLLLT